MSKPNDQVMVTLREVAKRFPSSKRFALEQISAEISAGAVTGIVGPDGAGKTTLMRLMAGLLLPSSGEIRVALPEKESDPNEPLRPGSSVPGLAVGLIGYMPQKFGLYEDLS